MKKSVSFNSTVQAKLKRPIPCVTSGPWHLGWLKTTENDENDKMCQPHDFKSNILETSLNMFELFCQPRLSFCTIVETNFGARLWPGSPRSETSTEPFSTVAFLRTLRTTRIRRWRSVITRRMGCRVSTGRSPPGVVVSQNWGASNNGLKGFLKWGYPQIIRFNRIFSLNHPFWGTPIPGNLHFLLLNMS